MAINRKDFARKISANLKAHKELKNKFLFRITLRGVERQKVINVELRQNWDFTMYRDEAIKESIKLKELWTEQLKGASIHSSLSINKVWELFSSTFKDTRSTRQLKSYYDMHIKSKLGHLKLENIKPLHLQTFYNEIRQSGLKPKTYNRSIKEILSPLFKFAIQNRAITFNPCDSLKLDKVNNKKIILNAGEKYKKLFKAVMKLYAKEPFYRTLFFNYFTRTKAQRSLKIKMGTTSGFKKQGLYC